MHQPHLAKVKELHAHTQSGKCKAIACVSHRGIMKELEVGGKCERQVCMQRYWHK